MNTTLTVTSAVFLSFLQYSGIAESPLAGFSAESQLYIREEASSSKGKISNWLVPFCTDLTGFLDQQKSNITPHNVALYAFNHFQPQWLPDGWTAEKLADNYPSDKQDGFYVYRKVPNTIFPIYTSPNGNSVYFYVWERKVGALKISMLHSTLMKSKIVISVHNANGLGVANPTAEELSKIAMKYFRLPPEGMVVPKDWSLQFEIAQKDARFLTGYVTGKFTGDWRDSVKSNLDSDRGGTWGKDKVQKGQFFYDRENLALLVSTVRGGFARTMPTIPPDVNWDAVEKKEKEEAESTNKK